MRALTAFNLLIALLLAGWLFSLWFAAGIIVRSGGLQLGMSNFNGNIVAWIDIIPTEPKFLNYFFDRTSYNGNLSRRYFGHLSLKKTDEYTTGIQHIATIPHWLAMIGVWLTLHAYRFLRKSNAGQNSATQ